MGLNLNAIGQTFGPIQKSYSWKDVALYALGVGAGFDELDYVYETRLKVLPSFAILTIYDFFPHFIQASGVNLAGILHGEHDLILHSPIPPEGGTLESVGKITAMYDKGKETGALVIGEINTYHSEGQKLFTNIVTLFSRLDGGFGGEPGPSETFDFPERPPDFEEEDTPSPDQPLIYRLSGDTFALHVDADFARMSGFEKPIMHGLCTHGFACRALIKHLFPGEPERLKRMRNRFTKALYPGTPIKTQIWKEEGRALFRTINAENGEVVIDRGMVEWMSSQEAKSRAATRGVRFDGQVAIVTGAGGGLGRIYALELAKRGAKVVVNDLGGSPDGSGASQSPAQQVVQEIRQLGGTAIPNFDSVASPQGAQNLVETTLREFGRIDILINNAGILRDKSFLKMTPDMWHAVLDVHLHGTFYVTHPVFQIMRQQGYGRIVFTTSAAGLFGNFGQSNYAAAKLGIVGLMNSLKIEGEKYNIKINTVAPLATTRLTQDILPQDLLDQLKPDFVAPLVLYLCSERCPSSGGIYNAAAGHFSRVAVVNGPGVWLCNKEYIPTPEDIAQNLDKIISLENPQTYADANAALMDMLTPRQATPPPTASPAMEAAPPQLNVSQVFQRLPSAFQAQAAAGLSLVFQFNLSGPQGGEWHAIIQDQQCTVHEGKHPNPTTTILMSAEDFLEYVSGRLNAMQAYSSGRLKIQGDLMKSQLIGKLFKF